MTLSWYALVPESSLSNGSSIHVFPAASSSIDASVNVHLVSLERQPVDLSALPVKGTDSVICLASTQPVRVVKNSIRRWSDLTSTTGLQGPWLWYMPCFFEALLFASDDASRQEILHAVDQVTIVKADGKNTTYGFASEGSTV